MSYLSLLLALKTQDLARVSGMERDIFPLMAWPDGDQTLWSGPGTSRPDEQALPQGIASMEHWLDLNA